MQTFKTRSDELFSQLLEVMPGGVSSPVRAFHGLDRTPLVVDYAQGESLIDVDGRRYTDFCCSFGAMIHGHTPKPILDLAAEQLKRGTSYSVTTGLEERLARKMIELVPSIEQVRFVNSGTEATMSAARLARGYTGRDVIVKFNGCYHGHADFFLVNAGSGVTHLNSAASSAGVPDSLVQQTISLPYNDPEAAMEIFEKHGDQIAAVIIEPIAGNMGLVPADPDFLTLLRDETHRIGALLIFDEVINGFRVAPGGAQELYQITPDLTTLSKIAGGGFPVGAFGGRREIMQHLAPCGSVYQAGTLAGNPVAMVAARKALDMLSVDGFYEELDRKAALLLDPVEAEIDNLHLNACIQRVGSMFSIFFGRTQVRDFTEARECDQKTFQNLFTYLLDNNTYLSPGPFETHFISMAHTDTSLLHTRDLLLSFLRSL